MLPLLFLPGIEGDPRIWRRVIEHIEGRETLAMALPRGASLHQVASAVGTRVPWPRFGVVGLSFGGLVGRALAEEARDAVAGLIKVGTLPARQFLPLRVRASARVLTWVPERALGALYRRRIHSKLRSEGLDEADVELLCSDLPDKECYLERLRLVEAWGLDEALLVPSLLLRGRDEVEAPWSLEQARQAVPSLSVEAIDGGHRAPWAEPVGLAGRIVEFMSSIPRP